MFKKRDLASHGTNFFAGSVELEGNLITQGDTRLECKMRGDVFAERLDLGTSAEITGKLRATSASVDGKIEGDLYVQNHLTVLSQSHILGNIHTTSITMDKGAWFDGYIEIHPPSEKKEEEAKPVLIQHTPLQTES